MTGDGVHAVAERLQVAAQPRRPGGVGGEVGVAAEHVLADDDDVAALQERPGSLVAGPPELRPRAGDMPDLGVGVDERLQDGAGRPRLLAAKRPADARLDHVLAQHVDRIGGIQQARALLQLAEVGPLLGRERPRAQHCDTVLR